MVMIQDEQFDLKAREEYLEDIEIENKRTERKYAHELAMVKAKQGIVNKYRTLEKLIKLIPYCVAIVGIVILGLAGKSNKTLEDFLK